MFVCCIRQDILGQFSMVNLELFNIVEDIKKVSKAFVVHPKNVNVDNSTSMCYFMEFKYYIALDKKKKKKDIYELIAPNNDMSTCTLFFFLFLLPSFLFLSC